MTPEDISRVVAESERRFRARTPATRVDEVNASYRVGRGEIRTWCTEQGIKLDELDPDFELAMLKLYVRLHREFPNEMWDHWNIRMKELAKAHKIRLPRIKRGH
jgi:hypothetical protein